MALGLVFGDKAVGLGLALVIGKWLLDLSDKTMALHLVLMIK